jgi:hypothetical protein
MDVSCTNKLEDEIWSGGKEAEVKENRKLFHVTGDSRGWGWVRTDKFMKRVTPGYVGSSDVAAYVGLIDVLKYVARGSRVLIKLDSWRVCDQLNGKRVYGQPGLRKLRDEVRKLIQGRELEVELEYATPPHHLASRLLGPRVRTGWWL